ncbi:hypothetical protein U9M48_033726 [Paspalum notatum var. saurae]|uniref:RING-type domain-containing protein n=1 Tax=Paspalum notatum var. saurae TaxID=547442 RepID=A0AAQ3UAM0_PASNO
MPDLEFELVELPPARKRACIPSSSKAIQDLLHEVTASGGGGDDECAICLQGFCVEEKLRAMPCSHAFHQHCIFEWLRRKTVCPLCHHQLMPTTEEDEERRRISTMVTKTRGVSAYHSDDDEAYIASLGDGVTIVHKIEMDVEGDMERTRTAWAVVERLMSERTTRPQT